MSAPRFPDGPKLELDQLLTQLVDRAQDVMSVQGRLRALLAANQAIAGNLAVPDLLRRTAEVACELAYARCGAFGLIDPAGGLEEFVYVGLDEATAERISHLPQGQGLIGAPIGGPHPIRLRDIAGDPRSVGFPAGHPRTTSFLAVPVRVRDRAFGTLYLTEHRGGGFTAEDEELVSALAATAGVAIENARLYEEAQRRQGWLQASTDVTRQLLAADGEDPLRLIARQARRIADADVATVVLPAAGGQRLVVEVASGEGADALTALTSPIENTLVGQALTSGEPVLVGDTLHDLRYAAPLSEVIPVGPVMVLPLRGSGRIRGALVIGRRHGRHQFVSADLQMATTFANHAAVALQLADARTDQQRIVLLEDRDRIARDLHDHVIQRMFAIGLTVQSVAAANIGPNEIARLDGVVADIDETIRQTRTTIFELHGAAGPQTGTARTRLLAVAGEVAPILGFEPHLRFAGPIDAVVPEPVVEDLVAVLREALTNAARHGQASRVDVAITTTTRELVVDVIDDGVGIGDTERRSGLANLRQRAEQHGGSLALVPTGARDATSTPRGTHLSWTIPLQ
ncbi:MAG: GAF domain-containing protein [bacterium]